MRKAAPTFAEPTEAEIQHAAYLLWVEEGRPEGRDLAHWLAAKEFLPHHPGRALGRGRRLPAPPVFPSAQPEKN